MNKTISGYFLKVLRKHKNKGKVCWARGVRLDMMVREPTCEEGIFELKFKC